MCLCSTIAIYVSFLVIEKSMRSQYSATVWAGRKGFKPIAGLRSWIDFTAAILVTPQVILTPMDLIYGRVV